MSLSLYKNSKAFSTRKVSVDQAMRSLGRNGIRVTREKAEVILDFLYTIAKTYNAKKNDVSREFEPKR